MPALPLASLLMSSQLPLDEAPAQVKKDWDGDVHPSKHSCKDQGSQRTGEERSLISEQTMSQERNSKRPCPTRCLPPSFNFNGNIHSLAGGSPQLRAKNWDAFLHLKWAHGFLPHPSQEHEGGWRVRDSRGFRNVCLVNHALIVNEM